MTINITLQDVGENLHPKITVLGVGGSGGNAVNNMINANLEGVDFLIANTDAQSLQISQCQNKIQLGLNSTRGLGAGMRPDIGRQAAEEVIQEVTEKLDGSHMLFIAAGMGGGTGTGAAPVIAEIAQETGALTVGVVTRPFAFEGIRRSKQAQSGIDKLQNNVDTLLVIPNQRLSIISQEEVTAENAFRLADDVLRLGVQSITELITNPGDINLDFADVQSIMRDAGPAWMSIGHASGATRSRDAAQEAITNPLMDVSIEGATGVLFNITGGSDLKLSELHEAAEVIQRVVDPESNIIFGMTTDHKMENEIKITIIATGFPTTDTLLQRDMARTVEAVNRVESDDGSLDLPPFLRRGGGNV